MHGNKYGAIFKDITYLLRRKKRKQVGGSKREYNVDFGNPCAPSSVRNAFSPGQTSGLFNR